MTKQELAKKFKQRCMELYQENRDRVVIGRRNTEDLLQSIQEYVDIEITFVDRYLPPAVLDRFRRSVLLSEEYKPYQHLSPKFVAYHVKNNQKSYAYYQEIADTMDDGVFLIFEFHSTVYFSNSYSLGCLARILRGIDQTEIDLQSAYFVEYMSSFIDPEEWVRCYTVQG